MGYRNFLICFVVMFFSSPLLAQDTLMLNNAVIMALEKNHAVRIARNQASISEVQAHPGNAGLLPTASLSSGLNYSINNTSQEFISPTIPDQDINGAESRNLNAQIGAAYTIFDGSRSWNLNKQLKELASLADEQSRLAMENTIMNLILAYYDVARLQDRIAIDQEQVEISMDRFERAKTGNEWAVISNLSFLNAEIDLNTDSLSLINSKLSLDLAVRNLNLFLGISSQTQQKVSGQLQFQEIPGPDILLQQALANNSELSIAQLNSIISELDLKVARSPLFPNIGLSASYGYSESRNDAGFLNKSSNLGFNGGVNLSYNIFDGNIARKNMEVAQLNIENARLSEEETRLRIEKAIYDAWDAYVNNIRILNFETRNLESVMASFERSRELYKLGQISSLDFRDSQANLARAQYSLNDARYIAKVAEYQLLRIAGLLLEIGIN